MREALASRPGDLALLEAMEAEHAAIEAIDRGTGPPAGLLTHPACSPCRRANTP